MPKELVGSPNDLKIYYKSKSKLSSQNPAFIYFSLSGPESLELHPYCQPAQLLENDPIHVFSFTLPFHGEGFANKDAMSLWAQALKEGNNFIKEFVEKAQENINYLISEGIIDQTKIAVGGLSRGVFIASHLAAVEEKIKFLLGFAPLTRLDILEEFRSLKEQTLKELNLSTLAKSMIGKSIRFYVGNRDIRISSDACYETLRDFVEAAHHSGVRSAKVDLIMSPSVGLKGHGTLPHTFEDGMKWLKTQLLENVA